MAYLVLVRHGLSEYNKKGLWTGWTDIPLAPEGFDEARKTAEELRGINFDHCYSSPLLRARQTLNEIKKILNIEYVQTVEDPALNERNYGIYTGKNKWQIKERVGEEEFQKIRRSWDYPIENGESLKQVYQREIPYYQEEIGPKLKAGKSVIMVSSGNGIRALVKYLENIPDAKISELEVGTGEAIVYQIDQDGKVVGKEVKGTNHNAGKV
ncbi:MAG: 2,3-bisphosphoglycerate-dependent phosphoglycerate mutase [Candidatus Levybacteria bacterium CG_4_10_14_0_2_um_filter_36_16]|nr:MAG: hypothetical protein AUK12_01950 [Candidatus Levybacteria bacterium CG2_30_37_29]PIZ98009.1 MAG: 2,3-bisphosphoglycerate-dependent phosphoglycerate mutase [Candidatus Levybacteria bacterium CG_4_10_14_0_2_um_filter_36_16]